MPSKYKKVRFETEYNSSFKAFDPDVYRSPLIEAILPESSFKEVHKTNEKEPAGLQSQKFTKSIEPPLQHKRFLPTTNDNHDRSPTNNVQRTKRASPNNLNSKQDRDQITKNETKQKNRALEFKAGLKPETSVKAKKHPLSEYERQFEWKKGAADDSPLLNAEKIVFDSHTNIPRFVNDKISHRTEYQSKYGANKIRKKDKMQKENIEEDVQQELPSSAVKRLLQTSQNPDIPFFPHGSSRVCHSEYQANFGSPKKYKYKEGIWLGAKPPHFLPDDESSQGSNGLPVTNWFEEVLELREKARQYKSRALEGNYFSREFLAKLDAELEEIFGGESNDSQSSENNRKEKRHTNDPAVPPRKIKSAWKDKTNENDRETPKSDVKRATGNKLSNSDSFSSDIESVGSESTSSSQEGSELGEEHFAKTYTKKALSGPGLQPTMTKTPKSNEDNSSGSDVTSERSDDEENCSKTRSKHFNGKKSGIDLDKFNIETVARIQSNDADLLGSSVRSIYGSNSSARENDWGSDCMSVSSFASHEALARDTLSRAAQRNEKFW